MADFQPFPGVRYDPSRVELSRVLCPPYDVIKGESRDKLIQQDAHNIVSVELAARYGEPATQQDYEKCASLLAQWRQEGVLRGDDASFYLYEQEFQVPGTHETKKRRGLMGALRLEEFGDKVQPHEHTLSGPKADRLQLLRSVRANTSPIFGLYADDDGWVDGLIANLVITRPDMEAVDADGIAHRLWKVSDEETQNAFVAALENEPVLIADGHHRYETALNFRNEARAAAEAEGKTWTGDEDENYVMMLLVATSDDGLIVLPTHRVVLGVTGSDVARLQEQLSPLFDVEEVSSGGDASSQAEALMQRLNTEESSGLTRIGMHVNGASYLLTLRTDGAHIEHLDASRSQAYNALDVTLLHELILRKELGIDAGALAQGGRVSYTIDARDAIAQVNEGRAGAAFFLRPTPVSQVREVAASGDKMPQKSTYFYPKLATGLVLRPVQ